MIRLAYGSIVLDAEVPSAWRCTTLELPPAPRSIDGASCIADALDHPIAGEPLSGFARAGDRIALVVSDKTRLCRSETAVPLVLAQLHAAGVRTSDVVIVCANGTHPRMTGTEVMRLLTPAVASAYRIVQHDARDARACVHVGTTRAGTPVQLNRIVVDCTKAVTVGTVVHHYFAGFGGGPKLFIPGVASYQTAVANHRRTLRDDGTFDPRCTDGNLADNPVALDIADAARFLPETFALAVLTGSHGEVEKAIAGEMHAVHRDACAYVDGRCRVDVDAGCDLAIVSTGGYPKDINLIQTHKALHHASYIVRPGGAIICVAECGEGLGNDRILPLFDLDNDAFRRATLDQYEMNAHTVVTLREKAQRFRIHLVSALPADTVRRMHLAPAASLQEAVDAVSRHIPPDARVAIIPNGSLLVPRVVRPGR